MATLAGAGREIPIVWSIRQSLYHLSKEKLLTQLVIRACSTLSPLPDRIVYNSHLSATQHAAFGFSDRRVRLIHNGFDTDIFKPDSYARNRLRDELDIPASNLAVGLVARVHPMKAHSTFLQAAAMFLRKVADSTFVLVGDGTGPEAFPHSALISKLGLTGRVRLCGRRTDIAAVNNALDIAVCSSSWGEAFPNALAEAMACGTPCVATSVGDAPEIIGDTGVVVPPGDAAALCAGWEALAILGESGRRELGVRARARIIERYSIDLMAERYEQLYDELSNGSSRCAG
jgi:glycosyltransferase involved in cell wall biosynthesis